VTTAELTRPIAGERLARAHPARRELTAFVGLGASAISIALVLGAPWQWLAFVGALVLACVPAGAAVMCWLDAGDDVAQAGLVVTVSLAVFAIASTVMIWLPVWAPRALLAIPAAAIGSCSARLLTRPRGVRVAHAGSGGSFAAPPDLALLVAGVASWGIGVGRLDRSAITLYGLVSVVNVWFVLGLVLLLAGFLLEMSRRRPRGWLLGLYLVALIVAIHGTVPILYGTPEYAWTYKHIGIVQSLGLHGHLTDGANIYMQWPLLFAAGAALSALGHVGPVSYATWAPVAFELADVLVLIGIFRLLSSSRRCAYLAALMYVGLVSWVGQDYFSPQAFGYLLWLAIVLIAVRWLRAPSASAAPRTRVARWRAPLLAGLPPAPQPSRAERAAAVALVTVLYFAIVAAHQLTPYMALAAIGVLAVFGLIRPRWLPLLLGAIATGYLAPRYNLIAHDFGGLFSGGNPIQNASGSSGTHHAGPESITGWIVRGLAATMWLGAFAVLVRRRRSLGRVVFPAVLAFAPFAVLFVQRYGGEAIYRVYLFSAPWCALIIAGWLAELRRPSLRIALIAIACVVAVFAGAEGLYTPVLIRAITPAELTASTWLYSHIPKRSLIVLPVDSFPALETANYNDFAMQTMPSDPQMGQVWLDERDLGAIEQWIADLGYGDAYFVFSRTMGAYADFFGNPRGYSTLAGEVAGAAGWQPVYRNSDATIYHLSLTRATATPPPIAAATTPVTSASARPSSPAHRARSNARGTVRRTKTRSSERARSAPR
jgi:hypothetical protein